jgi:hypothetical protein
VIEAPGGRPPQIVGLGHQDGEGSEVVLTEEASGLMINEVQEEAGVTFSRHRRLPGVGQAVGSKLSERLEEPVTALFRIELHQ